MPALPAAKAGLPVRAALCNQCLPTAQDIRLGGRLDHNLRVLIAVLRVKRTPHLVGFVEVVEHVLVFRADQSERANLRKNAVERIAWELVSPCLV